MITTIKILKAVLRIWLEFAPTTPPTINTIETTETRGSALTLFCTKVLKYFLAIRPRMIGTNTILIISTNKAPAEIGNHLPASNKVTKGVKKGSKDG